jgi:membrane protease YdiL (CAAX protease family)
VSTGPDIPDAQQGWRRVGLFCVLAFALAGATALVLQATGGIAGSRPLVPGTPITLAVVLLPTAYMFSPAVAHVLTRVLTREGWRGLGLVPHFGPSQRRLWLLAWLLPPALTLLSALLYFAVFPESFDPALTAARGPLGGPTAGQEAPGGGALTTVLALQVGIALTIAPFVNSILAFGEEFGWRGYLLPRLVALVGRRPALVVTGIVWGVWHWPLILMGYEYGLDYPGAPWLGLALFCIFTVAAGVLLGCVEQRERLARCARPRLHQRDRRGGAPGHHESPEPDRRACGHRRPRPGPVGAGGVPADS